MRPGAGRSRSGSWPSPAREPAPSSTCACSDPSSGGDRPRRSVTNGQRGRQRIEVWSEYGSCSRRRWTVWRCMVSTASSTSTTGRAAGGTGAGHRQRADRRGPCQLLPDDRASPAAAACRARRCARSSPAAPACGRQPSAPRSRSSPPVARARRWRWPGPAPRRRRRATRRRSSNRSAKRRTRSAVPRSAGAAHHRVARRPAARRHPHRGGATSYLEVLDAETRLFEAEIRLAQAREAELVSFVEVYRALGGGWQQDGLPGRRLARRPDDPLTAGQESGSAADCRLWSGWCPSRPRP